MNPKQILVVDDSAIIRKMVCESFKERRDIECSIAANGMIALEKLPRVKPDLVILDVEMPGLGGLETLDGLLRINPKLPVIMFSALTESGAKVSMEALAHGAADCLAKPSNQGNGAVGMEFLRTELVPRVESILGLSSLASSLTKESVPLPSNGHYSDPVFPKSISRPGRFDILAIASSTGGPNALHAIFESLPANLPVPVVCVQHMPPLFTKLLAERLSEKSVCKAHEVKAGEPLLPGTFYLAPGDFHFELVKSGDKIVTALNQGPTENSCRPAADVLFRSVAKLYGPRALGLVLTGMGQDGLLGCKDLKRFGGHLLAQDEATSVVWGMPGAVVKAGLADEICPIGDIAGRLTRLLARAGSPGNSILPETSPSAFP